MTTVNVTESPSTPTNRAQRRSIARRTGSLAGAGIVVAGSAAALLTALAGSAGASTTLTVDSTGDGLADATHCTDGTPYNCTIRDAAAAAVDGDTITFEPSIANITLTNGTIATQAVTITGPGAASLTITTDAAAGSYNMFQIGGVGNAVVSGITFTKNRVKVANNGNFTLDSVAISGSSGRFGGGALYGTSWHDLTIIDSTFENNTCLYSGGAVGSYHGGNTTISGSTFVNNHSGGKGGALYARWTKDLTITDSVFTDNSSDDLGGALAIENGLYANSINNSTIAGNQSSSPGGGVYLGPDTPLAINQTTISANTAGVGGSGSGGGIVIGSSTSALTMSGSIVSGNASTIAGTADISTYNGATGSLTATNSLLGDVDSNVTVGGSNNVYATDPMLGALADNGGPTKTMAPQPGSPAIDAGPNPVATFTGNEFDQRGVGYVRVIGGLVDIGAFEVQPEPPATTTTTTEPTSTTTAGTDEPIAPAFTG